MLISDVLRVKGHNVVKVHATDGVELAVRRLAEQPQLAALVVEDRWMKPVGIFSEQDFISTTATPGQCIRVRLPSPTTDVDTHYPVVAPPAVWMPCLRR